MIYEVITEFMPLCCPNIFEIGSKCVFNKITSKNRVIIDKLDNNGRVVGSHNCKLSTFNRCCKEIK